MIKTRFVLGIALCIWIASCSQPKPQPETFDSLAARYVRLGLTIGQYDPPFVDAYYGPDSLQKNLGRDYKFPKDSLLAAVNELRKRFEFYADSSRPDDSLKLRANWLVRQLTAFDRRIRIFSGEPSTFDEEATALFDVKVPVYPEAYYQSLVKQIDSILPGRDPIAKRVQDFYSKMVIPPAKVDTVFKIAIAEARKRTREHYALPAEESFSLEYVHDKPWAGYNWYKGNYKSVIQLNLDLPIYIGRAIDLACHEGYPGHHVYNMLLEKNLYRNKGWLEISMYPLFSPQSLIAEGSANYGIDVCFPGDEKVEFAKKYLFPLAGLDTSKAATYFKIVALQAQLNYSRNEVARGIINKTMTEAEAMRWLEEYGLLGEKVAAKSISFINVNRSYVICYNYGQDLVGHYIESKGGTADNPAKRWELFGWLLSNPVTPHELVINHP